MFTINSIDNFDQLVYNWRLWSETSSFRAVTAVNRLKIDTKWLATPVYPAAKRFPIDTLSLVK